MIKSNVKHSLKTVCFTGHRHLDNGDASEVSHMLSCLLHTLANCGSEHFCTGGALGFDTMAALCVIELKKEFPHISLDLVLPCRDQTNLWSNHDRALYNLILSKADSVEFLHEKYTSTCMHDRNRALVDRSDVCVAYLVHQGGGTAYTVSYAEKENKQVINIADLMNS